MVPFQTQTQYTKQCLFINYLPWGLYFVQLQQCQINKHRQIKGQNIYETKYQHDYQVLYLRSPDFQQANCCMNAIFKDKNFWVFESIPIQFYSAVALFYMLQFLVRISQKLLFFCIHILNNQLFAFQIYNCLFLPKFSIIYPHFDHLFAFNGCLMISLLELHLLDFQIKKQIKLSKFRYCIIFQKTLQFQSINPYIGRLTFSCGFSSILFQLLSLPAIEFIFKYSPNYFIVSTGLFSIWVSLNQCFCGGYQKNGAGIIKFILKIHYFISKIINSKFPEWAYKWILLQVFKWFGGLILRNIESYHPQKIFITIFIKLNLILQVLTITTKMKKVISTLTFVGATLGCHIGLQSKFLADASTAYVLSCAGGQGLIKYYVDGLPQGVQFDGASIVVTNFAKVGNYTIRIKAVDAQGLSVERVVTLSIGQSQGAAGSGAGQAGGAGGAGQAGGAGSAPGAGDVPAGGAPGGGAPSGGAPGGGAPGGGAPGGGAPGGGAPGGGAPGGDTPRLSGILSTYSSTTVTRPDYGPSGRYPAPNLPTAGDPNLPNFTPTNIANDQARPTPANRNPITPDDVILRAASDRHQNAIKGITNLLKIIDQARANKDKAQNDIQPYTQAYNDAVAGQRGAQNDIIAAQTRVSQIVTAINTLTGTIDDLRNKINQLGAQNDALNKQKSGIVSTITANEATKAGLLEKLKGLDNEVAKRVKELSDKGAECQSLNDAVNSKARQIDDRQRELNDATTSRTTIVADINDKTATVDDLRNQLQKAEKDLADAKIRLADIEALRLSLPVKIATLRRELDDLLAKAKACADQVARIQAIINGLKGDKYPEITNSINDLDNKISANRSKVSEIDANLAAAAGPLADLKAKLNQAQEDLAFIRTQKSTSDDALRNAYARGNDANNRVAFAKQNLDAVIKRFQDESKIVSDATLNLERARAEQALAKQGLEELIAHYTNALPYSIVPNGNLSTNPGTPYGNNPSGSPLGPVNLNGNGAPGSFNVPNWTNYLSTAYGAGVSPAFLGSVNQLFPFNFLSAVSGNMAQGTNVNNPYGNIRGLNGGDGRGGRGRCGADNRDAPRRVATGVVTQVRVDSFDVKATDGQVFTIGVAPCTQLAANVPDYKVVVGDKAVAKGWVDGQTQQIWGEQVTCVRR